MEKLSQLLTKGLMAVVMSVEPAEYVRPAKVSLKHQVIGQYLNDYEKQLLTVEQLLEVEITNLISSLTLKTLSEGEIRRLSEELNVYQNQQAAARDVITINIKERFPSLWGEVVYYDDNWQIIILEEAEIKELPGMIFMPAKVKSETLTGCDMDLSQWDTSKQKYLM